MRERFVQKSAWGFVVVLMMAVQGVGLPSGAMSQNTPAQPKDSGQPNQVPDSATAINLAEKALIKIYGKKKIMSERPLTGTLSDGVWHVTGTLYCKDRKGNLTTKNCLGGVAMADIRQSDGSVLSTGHTK